MIIIFPIFQGIGGAVCRHRHSNKRCVLKDTSTKSISNKEDLALRKLRLNLALQMYRRSFLVWGTSVP